jgi:hypothetical protein
VVARFRVEQSIPSKEPEIEPLKLLPPSGTFFLSCVVTDDCVLNVSTATRVENTRDTGSCLFDREESFSRSSVRLLAAPGAIPLDRDVPVYEITMTTEGGKPACVYRIAARFTKPPPRQE